MAAVAACALDRLPIGLAAVLSGDLIACRKRNWISGFLVITGLVVGGVAGIGFPSWGWTVWVGGVPLLLGIFVYGRLSGRRSIDAYPPLQRLRQAGCTDPN